MPQTAMQTEQLELKLERVFKGLKAQGKNFSHLDQKTTKLLVRNFAGELGIPHDDVQEALMKGGRTFQF